VLDRAAVVAYTAKGITSDPRTHARPAPLLADLTHALDQDPDPAGPALAARLAPYVTGSFRGLFAQPTSSRPDGHLLVVSLRDLPEELKAAGTLLALDTIWRTVSDPTRRRRRLVVVDEAWLLTQQQAGARFLARLAKSARKHRCGLSVITQDAADLLAIDLGQAVVANAATQILLGQAPQAIDQLTRAFGLTDGERQQLLAAPVGEGLLAGPGGQRAWFKALASPAEHALLTTDSTAPTPPAGELPA
jgi:type IV secretory pathway VirB4 component